MSFASTEPAAAQITSGSKIFAAKPVVLRGDSCLRLSQAVSTSSFNREKAVPIRKDPANRRVQLINFGWVK